MDIIKKFVCDVMNGKVTITEVEKQRFIKYYKTVLDKGYYLTVDRKTKEFILSNKHVERNEKQLANYDEFIQNIFLRVD